MNKHSLAAIRSRLNRYNDAKTTFEASRQTPGDRAMMESQQRLYLEHRDEDLLVLLDEVERQQRPALSFAEVTRRLALQVVGSRIAYSRVDDEGHERIAVRGGPFVYINGGHPAIEDILADDWRLK